MNPIHWPHLEKRNDSGNAKNPGNTGNNGNTPGKIGVSCVSGVGNTLETMETHGKNRDFQEPEKRKPLENGSVSAVSAPKPTLETQKPRENGSVSAVSGVSAPNSVSKGKPLPTPETLAAWSEYLSERSAVMEADGELSRGEADWRAWTELLAKYPAAASHFEAPPAPPPPSTYTRCTDCVHFEPPSPDTSFWCRQVRAHPEISLLAVCTTYVARPGTPPGPTVPPVGAS